jgi:type IV pilus assembly protein PilM
MSLKMIKGKTLPIGLDLGTRRIKMAQLRVTDGSYELLAAEAMELPATARQDPHRRFIATSEAIRSMLAAGAFVGRQCVLSLPAEATFVHHIRIPRGPLSQIKAAVAEELAGKLPYPVDEAVVRHLVAGDVPGEGEAKQEVIVAAASRAVLEQYLDMAHRAKLDVIGVDIEACAVVECFARVLARASDAAHATVFVDMGAASTQFVVAMGHQILFARNLVAGGDRLDQVLAEKLGVSAPEAASMRTNLAASENPSEAEQGLFAHLDDTIKDIADEMTQCLRYYESIFRHRSVERAIFVGGQAYDKRLCQALAQRLNLPAQIGDPLVRVKRSPSATGRWNFDWRQPQPAWAVAIGLSLSPTIAA